MLDELALSLQLMPRAFRFYPIVDSTNDVARLWLHEGAGHGAIVIADEQQRGRGRQGRTWITPPHSAIALTMILRLSPERALLSSMIGALSVVALCQYLHIDAVGIKWPNDVQIGGRKVCGILPEAVWQNDHLLGVCLGIGINVSVVFEDEMRQQAVSLEEAVSSPLNRAELIGLLVNALESWSEATSERILETWRDHLTTVGQRVQIGNIIGAAVGTDASGALLVQTDDHHQERIIAGDVLIL